MSPLRVSAICALALPPSRSDICRSLIGLDRRLSAGRDISPESPVAFGEPSAPRPRIGRVPIETRLAGNVLVQESFLVEVDAGRRAIGVAACIVDGPLALQLGLFAPRESEPLVSRANEHIRIVQGYFRLDRVPHATVFFDRREFVGKFSARSTVPAADLIGVDDQRIAVPEADRFAMPFGELEVSGRMSAAVRENPSYCVFGVGRRQGPY